MALMIVIVSIRLDRPPYTSRLTIRMPTSTHDIFTELVAQEIGSQTESVARGDTDIAAILNLVKPESVKVIDIWVNCPCIEFVRDRNLVQESGPVESLVRELDL